MEVEACEKKGEQVSMSGSIRRRSVYIATIVAMLAMAGGFALAGLTLSTGSNQSGQQVSSASAAGEAFTSASYGTVSATSVATTCSGSGGACVLVTGPQTIKVNAQTIGDMDLTVILTWASTQTASEIYDIQIGVSGVSATTLDVQQAATAVAATTTIVIDLGTIATGGSAINIVVTDCASTSVAC